MQVIQSTKLANVCYARSGRSPGSDAARSGRSAHPQAQHGQPGRVRVRAPAGDPQDILRNLAGAHGYGDAKGLLSARRAVVQHYQTKGIDDLDVEDIYLGNGVSELIQMSMQALLYYGDEV
ncbi:alanine transaminase OS=Streptomyces cyaneofuscatus OX=66883 GN=G3I52_23820 PE=3 SV=1 [Streptomyces cyaneofuscatus]